MKFLLVVLGYCVFAGVLAQECGNGHWQCNDGYCVPESMVCDGEANCIDGSDEDPSLNCTEIPCDGFRCNDTGRCIPDYWVCDWENDCRDGSDEIDCACDGFLCADGGDCLPPSWECDNEEDCADGSDEAPGVCGRSALNMEKIRPSSIAQLRQRHNKIKSRYGKL